MAVDDRLVAGAVVRRAGLVAGLLLGLGGCLGLSEDEVKRRFEAYVETANRCDADNECALASAACPLGCFVAVRADRQADVEAKVRELVAEYERGGRACAYGCIQPGPVACRVQRCVVLPFGATPDGGPP